MTERYDVWRIGSHGPILDTDGLSSEDVATAYAKAEHNRNGGSYLVRAAKRRCEPCTMQGVARSTP
jgi:hypothetical protein